MMKTTQAVLILVAALGSIVYALDNGLARTPPMGWLSWERYRCNIDCLNDPDNCIRLFYRYMELFKRNRTITKQELMLTLQDLIFLLLTKTTVHVFIEKLYKTMADLLVSEGYKDKGYEYVNVDDCWMSKERDANGSLVPDPDRFPNGISGLADYVHSKGLKLGIYEDFGTFTCGGYPGSKFYLEQDADTFAKWGVDMVKLDGCYTNIEDMDYGYPVMEFYLNKTGRPMLYSCSWPAYIVFNGKIPDYKKIAATCNIWRNYADIQDSWDSVKGIIEFYGNDTGNFSLVAGPGNFNDPDMIIVGDYSLSYDQERVQMALWSIMAAPLLMSNDLRNVKPEAKALLQNDRLISVNQDKYGIEGRRILKWNKMEVWTKPMGLDAKGMAFAFLNLDDGGGPVRVSMALSDLGMTAAEGYNVTEAFTGTYIGVFRPHDLFNASVDPAGVYMAIAYFDP